MTKTSLRGAAMVIALASVALWSCKQQRSPSGQKKTHRDKMHQDDTHWHETQQDQTHQHQTQQGQTQQDETQQGQKAGVLQRMQEDTSQGPNTAAHRAAEGVSGCPTGVLGTKVSVSNTRSGVALAFTTDEGDVGELRERVAHMARTIEMHRDREPTMHHRSGGRATRRGGGDRATRRAAGPGPMPAADASVTDIARGAKLELRPVARSQLARLRERVRRQRRTRPGVCAMLQRHPPGPSRRRGG